MKRCRPNGSVRLMNEQVRGITKHKHKLELVEKKHTNLFSTYSTQEHRSTQ